MLKHLSGTSFFLLAIGFIFSGCTSLRTAEYKTPWERRMRSPAYSTSGVSRSGVTMISWPVKKGARVTRGFRGGRSPHHGVDLAQPIGSPVLAAHGGFIVYAGRGYNGYGKLIILDDGKGWSSFYAHLSRFLVNEGTYVERGTVIGTIGRTGRTTGAHLHFELRQAKVPVDPLRFLP